MGAGWIDTMTKLDKEIQEGLYDPKSQKVWEKIAVHKELVGVQITESANRTNDKVRRFTATIRGWRNWKLFEGEIKPNTFKNVIELAKIIRERIDSGDESIFKESKLYDPKKPATAKQSHVYKVGWKAKKGFKTVSFWTKKEMDKQVATLKKAGIWHRAWQAGTDKVYDIKGIADSLRRQGIEPDLIDIEAEYDHNLSHSENLKRIKSLIGARTKRSYRDYSAMQKQFYRGTGKLINASPEERAAAFAQMRADGTLRGYDPKTSSIPPTGWYEAMVAGIKRSSDVRNPYAIVKSIWSKLSPSKKAEIKAREKKGERFKYNLPLPVDKPTKGVGTVRMVKPFKLAEVQVNLSVKDYLSALKSGIFSRMKRQDGTTALVARCKSPDKNVNIFVDKAGK